MESALYSWGKVPAFLEELPPHVAQAGLRALCVRRSYALVLTQNGHVLGLGLAAQDPLFPPEQLKRHRIVAIAAGEEHALALNHEGQVIVWGSNTLGQCEIPRELADKRVAAICSGQDFSLALTQEGGVHAWGSNKQGQLDLPDNMQGVVIEKISSNGRHSLALSKEGRLFAWGANELGQSSIPEGFQEETFVNIAAGKDFSLAVHSMGFLMFWGGERSSLFTDYANAPRRHDVLRVWAGESSAFVLYKKGEVHSIGESARGRAQAACIFQHPRVDIAQIASAEDFHVALLQVSPVDPMRAACDLSFERFDSHRQITSLGPKQATSRPSWLDVTAQDMCINPDSAQAPQRFLLPLDKSRVPRMLLPPAQDGDLKLIAGSRPNRLRLMQRGCDDSSSAWMPVKVVRIATGDRHSMVVTQDGRLYVWGHNDFAQLKVPAQLRRHQIAKISITASNNLAISQEGKVFIWGCCMKRKQIPQALEDEEILDGVVGGCMNILRTQSGRVYTFGGGVPEEIPELIERTQDPYAVIAAGATHCLGITQSGKILTWGQKGDCPQVPADLSEHQIRAIDCGRARSWALTQEGKLYCWKASEAGTSQLCLMTQDPTLVEIAASEAHCIARTSDGKVLWIDGDCEGDEGDEPGLRVLERSGIVSIASDDDNALGLTEEGELCVWGTWGYETGGSKQIYGLPGDHIRSIEAHGRHTLLMLNRGVPIVWSENMGRSFNLPPGLFQAQVTHAALSNQGLVLGTGCGQIKRWRADQPDTVHIIEDAPSERLYKLLSYRHGFMGITQFGKLVIWDDELEAFRPPPPEVSNTPLLDVSHCWGLFAAISLDGRLMVWDEQNNEMLDLPVWLQSPEHLSLHSFHNYMVTRTRSTEMHMFGYETPDEDSIPDELEDKPLKKLIARFDCSLALDEEGQVYTWADEDEYLLELPELLAQPNVKVVDIAGGTHTNYALVEMAPRYLAKCTCCALLLEAGFSAAMEMPKIV